MSDSPVATSAGGCQPICTCAVPPNTASKRVPPVAGVVVAATAGVKLSAASGCGTNKSKRPAPAAGKAKVNERRPAASPVTGAATVAVNLCWPAPCTCRTKVVAVRSKTNPLSPGINPLMPSVAGKTTVAHSVPSPVTVPAKVNSARSPRTVPVSV